MIDELISYLDREADRVSVRDALADIESGVLAVPVRRRRGEVRWIGPALVGTAAALVVVFGVAAARSDTRPPAAGVGDTPVPVEQAPAPTTAPAWVPLPEGGTFQGFAPTCTTRDNLEFECIVKGYGDGYDYGEAGVDWSGYQYNIVSADGIVIGGCLTTAWDAATETVSAHCALGERAVELNLVYPPALGQPAQGGWANG